MPIHALFPTAIVFNWHSDYSVHKATVPAREWTPGGVIGFMQTWNGNQREVSDMIDDLVVDWKALNPTTSVMDDAVVYVYAAPGAPAIPVASRVIAVSGTLVGTAVAASQGTFTMRDSAANKFKFVLLDTVPAGNFASQTPSSMTPEELNLFDELSSEDNAWQSRAGFRIVAPVMIAWTLNQALQQAYRRRVV